MSVRSLICIGCNQYDHFDDLHGAEADATGIFNALMKTEIGDYDVGSSRLLLSPTLQSVRESLVEVLFGEYNIDTFTIAFAGHGGVSGGSFYMSTRDSRSDALSATALSLADLFRMIAEASPKQTYVFIDACQSGGLISDLNVILKSEVMGEIGTPGITLLATAASNESAIESYGKGVGTTALLQCINGDIFLQDSNPALDLVEIGRAVSEKVGAAGEQNPVVWGLNLYGPSSFCKNPHASSGNAPLRSVLFGWPSVSTATAIRDNLPRLWEPYISISTRWNPRALLQELAILIALVEFDTNSVIDLVRRVTEACVAQTKETGDQFREIEVRAVCTIALLPYASDGAVAAYMESCCIEIGFLVERKVSEIHRALEKYPYAINNDGLSDLYYLPIRLSKILGWLGYIIHAKSSSGLCLDKYKGDVILFIDKLLENYNLSVVAMSDLQSPYVLSFMTAMNVIQQRQRAEELLGYLFLSVTACQGRVARHDLDPSRVVEYLICRSSEPREIDLELVAQPSELICAILRCANMFDMGEVFDLHMETLDHVNLIAYVPNSYAQFGAERIMGGTNFAFNIGHDIWSVDDLQCAWPDVEAPGGFGLRMTSLLASLIFPDRTPWFLLDS